MKPLGKFGQLALLLAASLGARAQSTPDPAVPAAEPSAPNTANLPRPPIPSPEVPFAPVTPTAADNAGVAEAIVMGQSALGNGLASLAIDYFQNALANPGLDQNTRDILNLSLATAFLAQSETDKAQAALRAVAATGTPAYMLRNGLLLERGGKWADATALLAQVAPATLNAQDRPWYYLAQAALAEQRQDLAGANAAWDQASANATTTLQKAQFEAARWRAQILLDPEAAPDAAAKLEASLKDPNLDSSLSVKYASLLAVVYDKLGRRAEALTLLSTKLMLVDLDRQSLDALRLEYVRLDQEDPATANVADDQTKLKNILDDWPDKNAPDYDNLLQWQEKALANLENGVADKVGVRAEDLTQLKNYIDQKVADPRGHPLLKQLYLLQTQLDLALQQYAAAATAARHVLDLPSEPDRDLAREGAWRTLAFVAWSSTPKKYREAASNLESLHKALPDDLENKTITALLADLYFLNGDTVGDPGDYLNAAAYYTSLLDSPPLTVSRGTLLVRAVECQLKADKLDDAANLLDQTVGRYDIPPMDRWSAECNLLMALRDHNRSPDAFRRLARLLDLSHGLNQLPVSLRLRLRWLDATLAFDTSDASAADKAKTLQAEAEAAQNNLPKSELNARELAANGLLLEMQAAAQAGQPQLEQAFSAALRANYPDTVAAVEAQFIIADELAAQNKFADAQLLMKKLADQFEDFDGPVNQAPPGAEYAPLARFYEALNAISLESTTHQYADALGILKQFVAACAKNPLYAGSPLIYNVRSEQGILEMQNNDFLDAKNYFDELLDLLKDRPRRDPQVTKALEYRAQCLVSMAAEAGGDVAAKRKTAMDELERLLNNTELPVTTRVHAGFLWGTLLAADDTNLDAAARVYFQTIQEFLLNDPALARQLDDDFDGRAWMSRCCLYLGKLKERQGLIDEARHIYQLAIDNHLGYDAAFQNLIATLHAMPMAAPTVSPAAVAPISAGSATHAALVN